ncbi:MAG: response regulator [Clostridia bacterium]|nr:response regulator [Clostridia bacterium]
MGRFTVLFADDFEEVSKKFCGYKNIGFDYIICEKDGSVILEELYKNPVDVVVMDFVMKSLDALGVLERMKRMNPLYAPAVIILSSVESIALKNEFYRKGADFYLRKPVRTEELIAKINEIKRNRKINNLKSNSEIYRDESEVIITNIIQQLCVPAHLKGYNYLRYAIKLCVDSPVLTNTITKELYPDIAINYSVTSGSVERNIRTAIELAWQRGSEDVFSKYFGYNKKMRKNRPTNAEFIARISDEIRLIYDVS